MHQDDDNDLRKYLPTEETIRRVMDRAASEENMQRALEGVRRREAQLQREPPPMVAPVPGEPPAKHQGAQEEEAAGPRNAGWRWTPRRLALCAVGAAIAPAVLVYWLLVPHGPPSAEGDAGATAGPSVQASGAMGEVASGAPVASAAPATSGATAASASATPANSSTSATPAVAPTSMQKAGPTGNDAASVNVAPAAPPRATTSTTTPARPPRHDPDAEEEIFNRPK